MIIQATPPLHLTYCLNIHPGVSWAENFAAIREKAAAVKQSISVDHAFGLGLRVAADAAAELCASPDARHEAARFFHDSGMYPFSVNAFPYGRFHAGPVKQNVYAPDWRTAERRDYTIQVANVLAEWLPANGEGSISTVPCSYKPWIQTPEDVQLIAENLAQVVAHLVQLKNTTGKTLHLGLEPEPDCFLETTSETIRFFKEVIFSAGVAALQRILQNDREAAEQQIRQHLGVCFDTCHVALQYEDPLETLRAYQRNGILISKVQLSAALHCRSTSEAWEALRKFDEPVYLHQVKGRASDGRIVSWPDLGVALNDPNGLREVSELRCHFHVPLFFAGDSVLQSTASTLTPAFFRALRSGITAHAEIETYTFDILPPEVHPGDIVKSIAREYAWVLERL